MKILCCLFVSVCSLVFAYQDDELDHLWSRLSNINQPKLADYRLVEDYLKNGKRPYIDVLRQSAETLGHLKSGCLNRVRLMINFMLIGPNGEMPIAELHRINVNADTSKRCIVLYSSYNGIYPEKLRALLAELKTCGYSGNVLLRIGGFPNIPYGGLKLCHIPYAFKVAALREAQELGYEEILWLDTALHPLTNLEMIFQEIKNQGHFFTWVGTLKDNEVYHLVAAAQFLGVSKELYGLIPHLSSAIIGLNMKNPSAVELLETWYRETKEVYGNLTWFPEELSLAIAAWFCGCQPQEWFGRYVCAETELAQLLGVRPLQFYLDARR